MSLTKQTVADLERLIHFLEGTGPYKDLGPIPDKLFNMMEFNDPYKGVKPNLKRRNSCKTAACIGGWATTIKEFREGRPFVLRMCDAGIPIVVAECHPERTLLDGYMALAAFFNLPYEHADALFSPGKNYETPKEVSRALKKYIARGGKKSSLPRPFKAWEV